MTFEAEDGWVSIANGDKTGLYLYETAEELVLLLAPERLGDLHDAIDDKDW